MAEKKFDAFISYRRSNGLEIAYLIKEKLEGKGLKVFFDINDLYGGMLFPEELSKAIANSKSFLLILTEGALDRCTDENDWVRKEIEFALQSNKEIIPLMKSGFIYPQNLPTTLKQLPDYQGLDLDVKSYFNAFIEKLVTTINLPPVSQPLKKTKKTQPLRRMKKYVAFCLIAALLCIAVLLGLGNPSIVALFFDKSSLSVSKSPGNSSLLSSTISATISQLVSPSISSIPLVSPPMIVSFTTDSSIVRNGGNIKVYAGIKGSGLYDVYADFSQLDSTITTKVNLHKSLQGSYEADVILSFANIVVNGEKTITLYASDNNGNIDVKTIVVNLLNPAPILNKVSPSDGFDGNKINTKKWETFKNIPPKQSNGLLMVATHANSPTDGQGVVSKWKFTGDFDVQIDFEIVEGWAKPKKGRISMAFWVKIDGFVYSIERNYDGVSDSIRVVRPNQNEVYEMTSARSGKFRIIRSGNIIAFLYNIGYGWKELARASSQKGNAEVEIGCTSWDASQAFTGYYDNFIINSGLTTYTD